LPRFEERRKRLLGPNDDDPTTVEPMLLLNDTRAFSHRRRPA